MDVAPTVLVCDDDELLVELIEFRLVAKGYTVLLARDGEQALEMMTAQPPDMIVLDAMMPGMDGFEVLGRIKADDVLKAIPVIMLTARKDEKDIVSALEIGAADYIVKPFIPDELLARIQRYLPKG